MKISTAKDLFTNLGRLQKNLASGKLDHRSVSAIESDLETICQKASSIYKNCQDRFSKASFEGIISQAQTMFKNLEKIEVEKNEEDLQFLEEISSIAKKIDTLALKFLYYSSNEIQSALDNIEASISAIKQKNPYNAPFFKAKLSKLEESLENLKFRFLFPIVEELENDSLHITFAYRVLHTLDQKNLKDLHRMKHLAGIAKKIYFHKNIDSQIKNLDEKTLIAVKQNIFSQLKMDLTQAQDFENFNEILAGALMQYVADELMASHS
ncbi:MAG: hypothetical protein HZB76_04150 [Chlamydiae bacterium]|nr:hypothetical protein [Chlamydiota bacterium]